MVILISLWSILTGFHFVSELNHFLFMQHILHINPTTANILFITYKTWKAVRWFTVISKVTDLISKRVPNSAYTNLSANYTENVCIVVMLNSSVWEMPGSNLDQLSGYPIVGFSWFSTVFPTKFQA